MKREERRESFALCSAHSMVTGRVAELDAVEKAVVRAGQTWVNCFHGLRRPTSVSIKGRTTTP